MWKQASLTLVALFLGWATTVAAEENPTGQELLEDNGDTLTQVTSVSQLTDVKPTDWAYDALRSLVERFGCIAGYQDSTFKGNRALTRYEFAAALNACLQQVDKLIGTAGNFATKSDLEVLQRLTAEFQQELAALGTRVDVLEGRVQFLENHQFSTTTKLVGEAIFAVSDAFGGTNVTGFGSTSANASNNGTVLQNRIRLDLLTSFSGKDRLRTRLQSGNAVPLLTSGAGNPAVLLFANEGRLSFDDTLTANSSNAVNLSLLDYSFPMGDRARITAIATGGSHFNYASTVNPYLENEDGGSGAISRFAQRNPIYGINSGGAGVAFNFKLSPAFKVDLGYLANRGNNPSSGFGLFSGNYSALGQVVYQPSQGFQLGLTYVNGYNIANNPSGNGFRFGGSGTATGSFLGNVLPGAQSFVPTVPPNVPIASNSYGVQTSWQINPNFLIGGWVGWTQARLIGYGDADIWNYALTLTFPNLGSRGSLGGIVVGVEPTLKGLQSGGNFVSIPNREDSWHIEGFYKYQISDNIAIAPGIIWLPAINQRSTNDDIFIGTIRTTFTF